jgi:DNA-binding NarL/FixJ family response regulator
MTMRLLLASPDDESIQLLHSLLDSALDLVCFDVLADEARSRTELMAHVQDHLEDIILLDWTMAEADTPDLVQEILQANPQLRLVVLLPNRMQQYRRLVWNAGACNSIPKEHMEQEWLSSVLCVMYRAMEREARLVKMLA